MLAAKVRTDSFFDGRYWDADCPEEWTFRKDTSVRGYPYVFETVDGCRLQLGTSSRSEINFGAGITHPEIRTEGARRAYVMTLQQAQMAQINGWGTWLKSVVQPITAAASKVRRHDAGVFQGFTYATNTGWAGWFSAEPWSVYAVFQCGSGAAHGRSDEALGILASIRFHDRPDPPRRRHLLFDLDGTLNDPRDAFLRCLRHAFDRAGVPCPREEELVRYIGPPLQQTIPMMLGAASDARLAAKILELFRQRFAKEGVAENVAYPGIGQALFGLRKQGYSIYVATSKPRVFAERIVRNEGLWSTIEAIHGSDLEGLRTAKGEIVADLLQAQRIEPSSAVMIGDRADDICAAAEQGMPSIGALWGYGSADELQGAGASTLCARPDELLACLASIGADAAHAGDPS